MPELDILSRVRRLRVLVLVAIAALAIAMYDRRPRSAPPAPTPARPVVATVAPDTPAAAALHARAEADSAEAARAAALTREWLGPQRWMVSNAGDTTAQMTEVALEDSTAADLMDAFVTIGTLRDSARRDSAGQIELLGGAAPGRAVLVGDVDSLVRAGVRESMDGCSVSLMMPVRLTSASAPWAVGFVPGMVSFVTPSDTGGARPRAEALRLLEALPDSQISVSLDSLRTVAWSAPDVTVWRDGELEVLAASRRRVWPPSGYALYVEEELVVAERPAGAAQAFAVVLPWHVAYDPDQTSSAWVEAALRVGPARRFALLMGYRGKEGGGGSLFVRRPSAPGTWKDAVSWSSGC